MRHLPLRLTLVTGIALLALSETALLFISANTYRDLAFENHRQALAELIGASVANRLQVLEEHALDFAKSIQTRELVREGRTSHDTQPLIALLNNQFHQYFNTSGLAKLEKIFVLDTDLAVVAASTEHVEWIGSSDFICSHVVETARNRTGTDRLKSVTELCAYGGRAHMAVLVPVGTFRPSGYLLLVVNPAFNLTEVADALGIPLRVVHDGGDEEFRSERWPGDRDLGQYLIADYRLRDHRGVTLLHVHAARDIEPFQTRVQNTTWVVVVVAALLSGPLFIAAFIVFNRMAGRTTALIAALEQEVSERKNAEKALLAAKLEAEKANQAKSQFLANMSHEIRTPMNAVLGYAQILDRDASLDDKHRRTVNVILRSGNHLLDIINEILDLSKIEAGRAELHETVFDLGALIRDIGSMFELRCLEKGLVWQIVGPKDDGRLWVRGDQGKLKQVLINLLGNAVKFTEKGHVSLTVEQRATGRFAFEVTDTGPGIRPEQHQKIFESFFQADYGRKMGGTGLGLAISRRHVELMGGSLQIKSYPPMGATFFFDIPLAIEATTAEAAGRYLASNEYEWNDVTALVLDEIDANRDVLTQLLQQAGLKVDQAAGLEEGLACIEKRRPDVVFVDARLVESEGLLKLTQIRQQQAASIVFVILTASTFVHDEQRFVDAGCDAMVTKPFDIRELLAITASLLKLKPLRVTATAPAEAAAGDINWDVLPDETVARIREFAELGLIGEVRGAINELAAVSADGKQLAERLRAAAENYDLDQLVDLLSRKDAF